MEPVSLFNLATQQAKWLSVRQAAVSNNIANANTPGYGAVDIEPFEAVLKNKHVSLASTHPKHVSAGNAADGMSYRQVNESKPTMPSGNTVELETELMKGGEVRRAFELNTAITRSFHRMLLMATKG